MDLQLKNKTAFISGSTSGIGFATAKILAQEGVTVIINGRTNDSVNTAVTKLKQTVSSANVSGIAADFGEIAQINDLISKLPHIDILINNVGVYKQDSFYDASDDDWNDQFNLNVMSGVRLARALLPQMMDQKWGRIIFVSSECAALVPEDLIPYSMTKAAILAVSRGLAQLTKGSQVTVNTVLPGSTLTHSAEQFLEDTATREGKTRKEISNEFFSQTRTSSLLQRFATAEEVGHTIAYYCSPLAAATNGASIKIEGGSIGGI